MNTNTNNFATAGAVLIAVAATVPAALATDDEGMTIERIFAADGEPGVFVLGEAGEEGTSWHQHQELVVVTTDDGTKQYQVQVKMDDGDLSVVLNGEEVPADRIVHKDGQVIILDENGNEIDSLAVGVGHGATLRIGAVPFETPSVMMGFHLSETGPALEKQLRLEKGTTTLVTAIYDGLPAHRAGMGAYDIITRIDGKKPADPASLRTALANKAAGDTVRLSIISAGTEKEVAVQLDAYDHEKMAGHELIGEPGIDRMFGVHVLPRPHGGVIDIDTFWESDDGQRLRKRFDDIGIFDRGLILDDKQRMFEVIPNSPFGHRFKEREAAPEAGDDSDAQRRLRELQKRLGKLEKLLEELLERAEQ